MTILEKYKVSEEKAVSSLPLMVTREFQPITFLKSGYCTTVSSESELWKYFDVMQEFRTSTNINNISWKLSPVERENISKVVLKSVDYYRQFGREILPLGFASTSRSILQKRAIDLVLDNADLFNSDSASIFEIGPGSGRLCALVAQDRENIQYNAMEATQAFFIFQAHFWSALFENDYRCSINDDNKAFSVAKVKHYSWWHFLQLAEIDRPVIWTINHAVNEISSKAFLAILAKISDTSTKGGCLVIEGYGGGAYKRNVEFLDALGFIKLKTLTFGPDVSIDIRAIGNLTPAIRNEFMGGPLSRRVKEEKKAGGGGGVFLRTS